MLWGERAPGNHSFQSLTGQVCLVINVGWQWLEHYTGRCHRAVAMLTLGEPSRPTYVGRLSKACTGCLRCSLLTALQLLYLTLWEEVRVETVLQGWSGSLTEKTERLGLRWVGLWVWQCQDTRHSSFSESLRVFHHTCEKQSPSSNWQSKAEIHPNRNQKMKKTVSISYTRWVEPSLGYLVIFMKDNYSLPRRSVRATSRPIWRAVPMLKLGVTHANPQFSPIFTALSQLPKLKLHF